MYLTTLNFLRCAQISHASLSCNFPVDKLTKHVEELGLDSVYEKDSIRFFYQFKQSPFLNTFVVIKPDSDNPEMLLIIFNKYSRSHMIEIF